MATAPKVFHSHPAAAPASRPALARTERDPYALRSLPQDTVFFFCKKIDNSRLVREPNPKSRGACWSAIGAACMGVVLLAGALAPRVALTMDGYKLEELRAEQRRLLDDRRELDLQEAQLMSPERLEKLAKGQNLVTPAMTQIFHLETRADSAVAMVKK